MLLPAPPLICKFPFWTSVSLSVIRRLNYKAKAAGSDLAGRSEWMMMMENDGGEECSLLHSEHVTGTRHCGHRPFSGLHPF